MTDRARQSLAIAIALVSIGFGIVALGRPYWTLESLPIWLGMVALLILLWSGANLQRQVLMLLVITTAITLLVERSFAVELLVYGVLAYTVFHGILFLSQLKSRNWYAGIHGVALVLLGILGTYWIDVASIGIGLLIGPTLIVAGARLLWITWRGERSSQQSRVVLNLGRIGSVLLLLLTVISTWGTYKAIQAQPVLDSFASYNQPLGDEPGRLLKAQPFTRKTPENSEATRILYTTTGRDGEIALATGLVIVPVQAPEEPMPVILWAHGTTGVAITCAPTLVKDPLEAGAMLFPQLPMDEEWAIVAPDYLGLGASEPHPYMVGEPAAFSSLDAVRAARQLQEVSLSDDTVVWGHSQGGGTALWIGILQQQYAPDVPLLGVAAMAPASNLPEFIDTLISGPAGPIFGGYILAGFSNWYEDVEFNAYVRPGARFSQQKLVTRCLSEPSFLANIASALIVEPFTLKDVHEGPIYERLQENVPYGEFPMPLLIGQGESDTLITPAAQHSYVEYLCGNGEIVDYRTYQDRDHMSLVAEDSPMLDDLMIWTTARFAGEPAVQECASAAPE